MHEAKAPALEIKPVTMFLDHGKLITQEFLSRDGHVLSGYRLIPEARGFRAWAYHGDLAHGFSERTICWFPTADAARTWVLTRVSGQSEPAPAAADTTSSIPREEVAA